MKRVGILLMVLLVGVSLIFGGCGNNDAQPNPGQIQEQPEGQQNTIGTDSEISADAVGTDIQNEQLEVQTLQGEFQGLADGHSAEIVVDNEPVVFQFYEETIAEPLNIMETGTEIRFDVTIDTETGVRTIVKLYENIE